MEERRQGRGAKGRFCETKTAQAGQEAGRKKGRGGDEEIEVERRIRLRDVE